MKELDSILEVAVWRGGHLLIENLDEFKVDIVRHKRKDIYHGFFQVSHSILGLIQVSNKRRSTMSDIMLTRHCRCCHCSLLALLAQSYLTAVKKTRRAKLPIAVL